MLRDAGIREAGHAVRPVDGEQKPGEDRQDEERVEQADVAVGVEEAEPGVEMAHGGSVGREGELVDQDEGALHAGADRPDRHRGACDVDDVLVDADRIQHGLALVLRIEPLPPHLASLALPVHEDLDVGDLAVRRHADEVGDGPVLADGLLNDGVAVNLAVGFRLEGTEALFGELPADPFLDPRFLVGREPELLGPDILGLGVKELQGLLLGEVHLDLADLFLGEIALQVGVPDTTAGFGGVGDRSEGNPEGQGGGHHEPQHPFSLRRRAISAATASSSLGLPSTARHWFIFTPIGDQASRSCSTVAAAPVPSRFTSTTYRARSLLTSRCMMPACVELSTATQSVSRMPAALLAFRRRSPSSALTALSHTCSEAHGDVAAGFPPSVMHPASRSTVSSETCFQIMAAGFR